MAPKAAPKADAKKAEKKEKKEPAPHRPEDDIPKVEQPKSEEFENRVQEVNTKIDRLQEKQKGIKAQIDEKTGGKDEYQSKRNELFAELGVWQQKIDEVKARKDAISGQFEAQKAEGQAKKQEYEKMRKTMKYGSEAEIDERIANIEFQLVTGSLPLREEKKLVAEIQELKKSRPKVATIKNMAAGLGSGDRGAALKEDRKALGEEMSLLIAEKQKVSEKIKALSESRGAVTGGVQELIDERNKISEQIKELQANRNAIRAEKREAEDKYRAYQAEVRKIRQERASAEREERAKEMAKRDRERKAEKLDETPFVQETTLIEQTIKFCQGLTGTKTEEKKEEKKEVNHGDLAGVEVLAKKEERDDEYYFVPTASKKKGKSKAPKADSGDKPIKHNAETFNLFSKLKLDAPITTAEIPALLEKLEAQLADYKEKIKKHEEEREEKKRKILAGEEEEEAAAEEEKKEE